MKIFSVALTILTWMGLLGCYRRPIVIVDEPPPNSVATDEERAQIATMLESFTAITAQYGEKRTFTQLPVLVVSEDWRVTKRIGFCAFGRFIAINRAVFNWDPEQSALFNVLLHEIGHCYFGRVHDETRISSKGYQIALFSGDPQHQVVSIFDKLCASVMCTGAEQGDSVINPVQLKAYYVGELIGRVRAKVLADLAAFARLQYVPDQNLPLDL